MSASSNRKRGRKPTINPNLPNYTELKKEYTKNKNANYYCSRGEYIHKILYLKKRYIIPT